MNRVLLLYRPRLPGQRAQAIQVVHAAEAMARQGLRVELLADRGPGAAGPEAALSALGLAPHPRLHLRIAPVSHSGLAGIWFRRALARWWRGPPGVVLARDKRRLEAALRRHGKGGHRIVLETHERDGATDPAAHARERRLLHGIDALVANCEGTLAAWAAAHPLGPLPVAVAHNATAPGRRRDHRAVPLRDEVLVMGSRAPRKGLDRLSAVSPDLPLPVHVLGPADGPAQPGLIHQAPVPYPAVPDRLAGARVLYLPVGDGVFGRELTSPLKLWDYLATARPIVAPDQPSVRRALAAAGVTPTVGAGIWLHDPHSGAAVVEAVAQALQAGPRAPAVRTWDERLQALRPLLLPGTPAPPRDGVR